MSFADVVLAYPASSHTRFAPVHFPHDRTLGDDMSDSAKILIVEDDYLAASEIEDVLREAGSSPFPGLVCSSALSHCCRVCTSGR